MYSFAPLDAIPAGHGGFYIIAAAMVAMLLITVANEIDRFFAMFFAATIICGVAYSVSYHLTNQDTQTFANTPVTATFLAFQTEGYNERSGKSRADRHYTYVVYTVNGDPVLLQAGEGITYPNKIILYKN